MRTFCLYIVRWARNRIRLIIETDCGSWKNLLFSIGKNAGSIIAIVKDNYILIQIHMNQSRKKPVEVVKQIHSCLKISLRWKKNIRVSHNR